MMVVETVYYDAWDACARHALAQYPDASQMTTHIHVKVRDVARKLMVTRENIQRFTHEVKRWLVDGMGETRGGDLFLYFEYMLFLKTF